MQSTSVTYIDFLRKLHQESPHVNPGSMYQHMYGVTLGPKVAIYATIQGILSTTQTGANGYTPLDPKEILILLGTSKLRARPLHAPIIEPYSALKGTPEDPSKGDPTLTYQNLLFCRVPINSVVGFIIRTYKKVVSRLW